MSIYQIPGSVFLCVEEPLRVVPPTGRFINHTAHLLLTVDHAFNPKDQSLWWGLALVVWPCTMAVVYVCPNTSYYIL